MVVRVEQADGVEGQSGETGDGVQRSKASAEAGRPFAPGLAAEAGGPHAVAGLEGVDGVMQALLFVGHAEIIEQMFYAKEPFTPPTIKLGKGVDNL